MTTSEVAEWFVDLRTTDTPQMQQQLRALTQDQWLTVDMLASDELRRLRQAMGPTAAVFPRGGYMRMEATTSAMRATLELLDTKEALLAAERHRRADLSDPAGPP
jgi:hypothetical protein